MRETIAQQLLQDRQRFLAKGLFARPQDSLSMRIPGGDTFLLVRAEAETVHEAALDAATAVTGVDHDVALHGAILRQRPDVGAVLIGSTDWSAALAASEVPMPTLFDEPARHIGPVAAPVAEGDMTALRQALSGISNVAILGQRRICLGFTSERVVLNAELFEKCAKAWVIASSCDQPVKRVPGWVCKIAGDRLRKDQQRAAKSYAAGEIPEGMNDY